MIKEAEDNLAFFYKRETDSPGSVARAVTDFSGSAVERSTEILAAVKNWKDNMNASQRRMSGGVTASASDVQELIKTTPVEQRKTLPSF